jgi:peptidase E
MMKRRDFVASSILGSIGLGLNHRSAAGLEESAPGSTMPATAPAGTRKILIAGGGFETAFIRYMASLTGKTRPRLCYLPTASADSPSGIVSWFRSCAPLQVEPYVQESFIASTRQTKSWEEVLLSMDGIVASGGNTLNQQAIWKAQGIDIVLKDA